jgi:hypothetical protein
MRKVRFGGMEVVFKRCCICDAHSTKIAKYPIHGTVRIEQYCDAFAEKQFLRID